ncbi:MAG: TRAP transporter TatT component family protein, partial [Acidobacteriota bacterium]
LYSYAHVDYEAFLMEQTDLDTARTMKNRARKLYLRALGYGMRGLEKNYPGIQQQLFLDPDKAVTRIDSKKKGRDLPFLYWSAAALGSAISVSRDDAALIARLPEVEALIDRGLELDEKWDMGAFHAVKIQLAGAGVGGADEELIKKHYDRALELSKGQNAGIYVAYAEAISIPNQDGQEFRSLMQRAMSIDLDQYPKNRLANSIAQRKARWLLDHVEDLILE